MNFSDVVVTLFLIVIAQGYVISPDSRIRSRREIFEDPERFKPRMAKIKIDDKYYSTEVPAMYDYAIWTNSYIENGEKVDRISVRIGNYIEVYKTVGGRTNVTDAKGNVLPDGGVFHVKT
ncbi:hypothetical protein DICVIV_01023 [Dictyocaulus viviparus]|uniref:Uncharacterized protein n=1 Tax=Dictyocaulus viviparus TaxID=29172 RepID=A0A0D8YDX7_DICVI|nr:hypothetical protein DICVIV_01023 [Dictyocaulus viviparus]